MKNFNYLIHSIYSNYLGYPISKRNFCTIGIEEKEIRFIKSIILEQENFRLNKAQMVGTVNMLQVLLKEIGDWEWETLMDYPKDVYRKEIIERFEKEIADSK